jgi:hypothetical protein
MHTFNKLFGNVNGIHIEVYLCQYIKVGFATGKYEKESKAAN